MRRLLLSAAGVLVALAVAEGALRLRASDRAYVWPPGMHRSFAVGPDVAPGVHGVAAFRVSSRGLRADELLPHHDAVVLAVGGSTTECLILDQDEAWPNVLQERLGEHAWVGNAGRSGRTTREHVLQVPRLLQDFPETDLLIVLAGVNDLCLRLRKGARYDPAFLEREGAREALLARAFSGRGGLRALLAHWWNRDRGQDAYGNNLVRWRAARREARRLRTELPDLATALAEYRRNVRKIVRCTRARGVRVLFLTQPTLWRADLSARERGLLWLGGVDGTAEYYAAGALQRGMALYNQALIETCRRAGVDCLDLAARIPKTTAAFYDDVHLNEHGARLVAEAVAEFVAR